MSQSSILTKTLGLENIFRASSISVSLFSSSALLSLCLSVSVLRGRDLNSWVKVDLSEREREGGMEGGKEREGGREGEREREGGKEGGRERERKEVSTRLLTLSTTNVYPYRIFNSNTPDKRKMSTE